MVDEMTRSARATTSASGRAGGSGLLPTPSDAEHAKLAGGLIVLCFLASLLEGADIQSMSLVATRLAVALRLGAKEIGFVVTAGSLGGILGALFGGLIADRIGRKTSVIMFLSIVGLFSVATSTAHNFVELLAMRGLTSVGLGGLTPNLLALVGSEVPQRHRATSVAITYCGMPIGGAATGFVLFFGEPQLDWRVVFYIAGFGSLVLVPLFALFLRQGRRTAERSGASATHWLFASARQARAALFSEGRAGATVPIWVSFFFTLMTSQLLLNWLPWLMMAKGLSRPQSVVIASTMSIGAAAGILVFGWLLRGGRTRFAVQLMYVGAACSFAVLTILDAFYPMLVASAAAGLFIIGGQLNLYMLVLSNYPAHMYGAGLGAASAAGRLGSITGPLVGGMALAIGAGPMAIIAATLPGLVAAGVAATIALDKGATPAMRARADQIV